MDGTDTVALVTCLSPDGFLLLHLHPTWFWACTCGIQLPLAFDSSWYQSQDAHNRKKLLINSNIYTFLPCCGSHLPLSADLEAKCINGLYTMNMVRLVFQ